MAFLYLYEIANFIVLYPSKSFVNIDLKLDRALSIKRIRINAYWYDIDNSVGGTNGYLLIY